MTEHTPEQLALAERIASNSAYIRGSHTWEVRRLGALAAIRETTALAAKLAERERQDFLSPEYATGQPLSSFQERFACGQIADALRTYAHLKDPSHADG